MIVLLLWIPSIDRPFKFLKTRLIFESLLSNLFGVAGRGGAFGLGNGRGGKWGCLCQAQRSRCLKFLIWSLPTTCHFSFSFTTAQVADKGFSGNGGCEMGPQLGVYSTSPGRETKIINSAKGGFVPAGARTPDVFFSGQDEER